MPKPPPTDLEQIKLFLQTLKQDLIKPTIITNLKRKILTKKPITVLKIKPFSSILKSYKKLSK